MKNNTESTTIASYITEWLNKCETTHSSHTVRAYECTLESYSLFLENVLKFSPSSFTAAKCLSRECIEKWMTHIYKTNGCSAKTCNARLASLRSFLKFLSTKDIRYKYLHLDSLNIQQYKVIKTRFTGMTENAIKALLREPDLQTDKGIRDSTLMTLLYVTAARIHELLSIKLIDIHMRKPYSATVIGKGNIPRTLYIPEEFVENLKIYIKRFHRNSPKDAYMFYSPIKGVGFPLTAESVNKCLKKYAKTAKMKCPDVPETVHAHQFRHAMATHWLNAGFNLADVSQMLGHTNIETTMIYLDITLDTVKKAMIETAQSNINGVTCLWKKQKNAQKLSLLFKR